VISTPYLFGFGGGGRIIIHVCMYCWVDHQIHPMIDSISFIFFFLFFVKVSLFIFVLRYAIIVYNSQINNFSP